MKKRKSIWTYILKAANQVLAVLVISTLLFTDLASILHIPFTEEVPEAHAVTGDFVIFREAGGTQTVDSSGTPYDVEWDTTVSSNSNITLQSNDSDIDLAEGGKYLVLYNAWTEQGTSTGGSNRRSVETYLTLNGNESEYGRASGFLRDSDNTIYAPASGGAILDVTAGDDLQLHIARDDVNTGAGTNIRPSINGMTVLKLQDSWDYLRLHRSATGTAINGNTSFTDVDWDTEDEVDTGSFDFSATSANITLKGSDTDHFLVTANVRVENTALSNTRQNYEMMLTLDGAEIPGTRVTGYSRGNQNSEENWYATLSYTGVIAKDASGDQTLNLEMRRESSSGATTIIKPDESAISIVALPDEGSYVRLTNTTNTALASTQTQFDWNSQLEVDSNAFSHSTTSNASRIEIDAAGDYLFFSTVYSQNSSNERQPHRIDWQVTGTTQDYGAHGAYVRGTQSFTGGSSAGLILNGLGTSDYVAITHYDETEAPTNNNIQADRVGIQGILLDDNFFGTDVTVSASSSQVTEADIPTTDVYQGGTFVIAENSNSRSLTNITFTESGSVDGSTGLDNIRLYYDLDTSAPYDCSDQSFSATSTETQFGVTDTNGFSGANGVSSFTGSVTINTTQTFCGYIVYDVLATSTDGNTVDIDIEDPASDVVVTDSGTVGPPNAVGPTGSTTLRNAELTQIHYHWRNDDGSEAGATSVTGGSEDTTSAGFIASTTRRLRLEVSAEGSTSSPQVQYRLEYGEKGASCAAVTTWVEVGVDNGGDWDMVDSSNLTNGANTTNIALSIGGVTDENDTFLSSNGGVVDTSAQTGNIQLTSSDFVELEYSLAPTDLSTEGTTYCFRVTDAGEELRNYTVYPEATLSADVTVSATGAHITTADEPSVDNYIGGAFVITENSSSRNVDSITITETGTINASTSLDNIELYYDIDNTLPYDCSDQSFSGTTTESQYGVTDTNGFSSANGSSTFTETVGISTTETMCVYVVLDVTADAVDGETIDINIALPNSEVVTDSGSVGPGSSVGMTGSTTVAGPVLTQIHYHWRNDDGSETTATEAGVEEDTPIAEIPKESARRLRFAVSNEGATTSQDVAFKLEFGPKVTTCSAVTIWEDVGDTGGGWDMFDSTNLTDGNDTTNIATSSGGVSDENTTFITPNAGVKDTSSDVATTTISETEYIELEFSIEATTNAGFDTTYCFRLTNNGAELESYPVYPELTIREQQDFFIQRGVTTITGTTATILAGTDYTAPAASTSAFIRITNTQHTGAGENADNDDSKNADGVTAHITDPENILTSITFERPSNTSDSADTRVAWEIVEFIGQPGTDNEMIVRDQRSQAYVSTQTSLTGPIVGNVADDSDVVIFITGQANPDVGTGDYNTGISTAEWSTSSQQAVFTRGEAGSDAVDTSYAVVEFTGANWNIQRVEHQYTATGTFETASITPVASRARTFLHTQKRVGAGLQGLDEMGHEIYLSSIGALSLQIQQDANTPSDHYSVVWVIENTQTSDGAMQVHRSNGALAAGAPGGEPLAENASIGETISSLNKASIFTNNRGSGGGTAFPRTIVSVRLISTSEYELWRSDTGQTQTFRTEVVEWPTAGLSIRQNYYQIYRDTDAIQPTDPWPEGASDLGENAALTSTDEPPGEGDVLRFRMTLLVNNDTMAAATKAFKLQYGRLNSTCAGVASWEDVGAAGSGEIWRGYDNTTPADGTEISSTLISIADVNGTYEEENSSAVNPNSVSTGQDVEYDWVVQHNGALEKEDYCFRMVESDGTELSGYNNYPTVRTAGFNPVVQTWRWYDDETSETPTSALAGENNAPINIANDEILKLRVTVGEASGAPGTNVKFRLQYSEYSDFREVFELISTSTCQENSFWCYADGAGVENAVIDSTVISDADACASGVGDGCGMHNEATTTDSSFTHNARAVTEYEFTLQSAAPRVNQVYYFRLFDQANGDVVVASTSNPSLATEGAELTFTVGGVASTTVVEGVTTDVDTLPTSISYGSLPLNTEVEAAQQLTVSTNATEGYKILVLTDQALISSFGETIDPVAASNTAPVAWTTGCPGNVDGCFGYHSGDDTLEGGSTRFAPSDTYAALETAPREVSYSSIPVTNETTDVVYKIQVRDLQPAGQYETSITYLAVPAF